MKNIFTFILVIILLIYVPYNYVKGGNNDELHSIANAVIKNGYTIRIWNAYQKDFIGKVNNEKEYMLFINQIKNENKGYKWEAEKDADHHFKLVGINDGLEEYLSHRIVISAFKVNNGYKLERTQEITGYLWNDKYAKQILSEKFSNSYQAQTFYNLKADLPMNAPSQVKLQNTVQKLISDLKAKEVEKLVENDFVSYSALSKKWHQSLKLKNNNKMNLQIAARFNEAESKVTVTLGTPIIIKEY